MAIDWNKAARELAQERFVEALRRMDPENRSGMQEPKAEPPAPFLHPQQRERMVTKVPPHPSARGGGK